MNKQPKENETKIYGKTLYENLFYSRQTDQTDVPTDIYSPHSKLRYREATPHWIVYMQMA